MQMELSVVVTQWLLCLFFTSVPNETAFRIWDVAFLLGPKVIFEVALAIFKTHEKQLLAIPDVTEIGVYLNRSVIRIFNCDELFDVSLKPLEDKKIMKLREQYKVQINKEMKEKRMTFLLEELARNTHFTSEELNQLSSQYEQLDPTADFGINMEAFTRLYLYLFQDRREDKQFIQQMFKAFDTNSDNLIDFKELVYGLSILLRGTVEEKLQLCFKVFDLTAAGSVNYQTMTEMLSSVYNLFCQEDCSNEVTFFVDMIFQAAQVPKETTLTYEQFKEGVAMQPFIMKCFNLDSPKQARYSLSISNSSSASSGESGSSWSPSITKSGSYIDLKPLVTFFKDRVKKT
jgi:Ca2+-binding EF-hand superfamily protein